MSNGPVQPGRFMKGHTVPDTFAPSHTYVTALEPGAAVTEHKTSKYSEQSNTVFPVFIETGGSWNNHAVELVHEIGKRITVLTEDTRETSFPFQRLSMNLQRRNVTSFLGTFQIE